MRGHSEEREAVTKGPQLVAAGFDPPDGYTDTPEARTDDLSGLWEWYGGDETPPRPVVDVPLPEWL